MADTVFRSSIPTAPEAHEPGPEPVPNTQGAQEHPVVSEPLESPTQGVLSSLGLEDSLRDLPEETTSKLEDIGRYVAEDLKARGVAPTQEAFDRTVINLKFELGLDLDATPETVIDRLGGVIQAWRELSFVRDPAEKRSLFMKLARQPDSRSMHRLVFEEMERRRVWQ